MRLYADPAASADQRQLIGGFVCLLLPQTRKDQLPYRGKPLALRVLDPESSELSMKGHGRNREVREFPLHLCGSVWPTQEQQPLGVSSKKSLRSAPKCAKTVLGNALQSWPRSQIESPAVC